MEPPKLSIVVVRPRDFSMKNPSRVVSVCRVGMIAGIAVRSAGKSYDAAEVEELERELRRT